ncbi:TPA: aldolase catalytic domain-containing protein [Campylobacter lari]|uniref:aldolase catalytic domain-containing protein n=1 Tax=Campylobacter sp. FU_497 TaxID=2911610 RepID=UPI0021E63FFE|nr:aldolase catalytic domain-containing protein [Campylobacter sp. FU_497]MCV3462441.1 aldolase catalytic domain-containing protein [Campylobacter sp. FU_497]HEC1759769.1 aldolase catalytic domain-containing protein [Campylobacter lari]
MKHLKILDCTLRDGAYIVDKKFGKSVIQGIIENLIDANIDLIEIGFLQNEGFGEGKTVFKKPSDAFDFLPENTKQSNFSLLADYSRYDFDLLPINVNCKINVIRICFFKHERFLAIDAVRKVIAKGYNVYVQPVDILGYSDRELLDLIDEVNKTNSACFSIVDTFGSMYIEDLRRLYYFINHNLNKNIQIGFHSHNNLQLSSALSQEFIRLSQNERNVTVDTSLNGMGRGAGNTPTELIALYANKKMNYSYNIHALLDCIDVYIKPIAAKFNWGYSLPYFIAGMYSAHTNNINYLLEKNNILSKDISLILSQLEIDKIKRYDYDRLEELYLEHVGRVDIDDSHEFKRLAEIFNNKNILVLAPGNSIINEKDKILKYIRDKDCLVVNINFIDSSFQNDFFYVSNIKRFEYLKLNSAFTQKPKIFLSNIQANIPNSFRININRVVQKGWSNLDNSIILFFRLLDYFKLQSLAIAGFDGFVFGQQNYFKDKMEIQKSKEEIHKINIELEDMFNSFINTRKSKYEIIILTKTNLKLKKGKINADTF